VHVTQELKILKPTLYKRNHLFESAHGDISEPFMTADDYFTLRQVYADMSETIRDTTLQRYEE
jgi:hypothetical protein